LAPNGREEAGGRKRHTRSVLMRSLQLQLPPVQSRPASAPHRGMGTRWVCFKESPKGLPLKPGALPITSGGGGRTRCIARELGREGRAAGSSWKGGSSKRGSPRGRASGARQGSCSRHSRQLSVCTSARVVGGMSSNGSRWCCSLLLHSWSWWRSSVGWAAGLAYPPRASPAIDDGNEVAGDAKFVGVEVCKHVGGCGCGAGSCSRSRPADLRCVLPSAGVSRGCGSDNGGKEAGSLVGKSRVGASSR
jgi:hypothetical protein